MTQYGTGEIKWEELGEILQFHSLWFLVWMSHNTSHTFSWDFIGLFHCVVAYTVQDGEEEGIQEEWIEGE